MSSLGNLRIVLGITGGIAAYKACEIIRQLTTKNAEVRVVLTQGAEAFITPLTLQALSGNPVHTSLLDEEAERAMGHIELAKWADLVLIAPASANFLARLAVGMADDLLTTLCLATEAPIHIAPAMNQAMWKNPATQANIHTLNTRGIHFIGPAEGDQACGDVGPGRMEEPALVVASLENTQQAGSLAGMTVTITAGPTMEPIDPVRYISNHSSGKMGYAIAEACLAAGATVNLITGPTAIEPPRQAQTTQIKTADQMLQAAMIQARDSHIFIGCAAVADYKPAQAAPQKLKKGSEDQSLETIKLIQNPDILATISAEFPSLFTVGFAAETENLITHATDKLKRKKLNLIVANDVSRDDIAFGSNHNAVTILGRDMQIQIDKTEKRAIAHTLVDLLAVQLPDWLADIHHNNSKKH